jgi:hypothetical protein
LSVGQLLGSFHGLGPLVVDDGPGLAHAPRVIARCRQQLQFRVLAHHLLVEERSDVDAVHLEPHDQAVDLDVA